MKIKNFIFFILINTYLSSQNLGEIVLSIDLPSPIANKSYNINILQGEYILLHLWGSWCNPCRVFNEKLVQEYEKSQMKFFPELITLFSVSLEYGQDKKKWIEAIEKDKMNWAYHVIEPNAWNSKIIKSLRVFSLPRLILLDKNSKILYRDIPLFVISPLVDFLKKKVPTHQELMQFILAQSPP